MKKLRAEKARLMSTTKCRRTYTNCFSKEQRRRMKKAVTKAAVMKNMMHQNLFRRTQWKKSQLKRGGRVKSGSTGWKFNP